MTSDIICLSDTATIAASLVHLATELLQWPLQWPQCSALWAPPRLESCRLSQYTEALSDRSTVHCTSLSIRSFGGWQQDLPPPVKFHDWIITQAGAVNTHECKIEYESLWPCWRFFHMASQVRGDAEHCCLVVCWVGPGCPPGSL